MTMIAALEPERQLDAERLQDVRRPRSQRDDDLIRVEVAGFRIDAPSPFAAMKRARVAGQSHAAERRETRCVGARHRKRI